jgi:hypothetical protein
LIGARDREKRTGTSASQRRLVEEIELPALATRQLAQRAPIAARVEHVRRQRSEPAGNVIAAIDGDRARAVEQRAAVEERER